MVQVDDVDRVDRGVGVGVRGQQHPAGQREDVHRLFEELDAAHLRHPVVGDEHRDGVAAQLEFVERLQGVRAGFGAHDPVSLAVVAAQVAGDGAGHRRVVVDGQDYGFSGRGDRVQSSAISMLPSSSGYAARLDGAEAGRFSDFGAGRRAGSMDQRCGFRAGSCVPQFWNF